MSIQIFPKKTQNSRNEKHYLQLGYLIVFAWNQNNSKAYEKFFI